MTSFSEHLLRKNYLCRLNFYQRFCVPLTLLLVTDSMSGPLSASHGDEPLRTSASKPGPLSAANSVWGEGLERCLETRFFFFRYQEDLRELNTQVFYCDNLGVVFAKFYGLLEHVNLKTISRIILDSYFSDFKIGRFPWDSCICCSWVQFYFPLHVCKYGNINDFETEELISRLTMIVQVNVVLNRIVVVDIQ